MKSEIKFLDRVEIAAPCHADWDRMEGDERARFCQECRLNVYNLSDMTRQQAEELIESHEGKRLCVRFFRRTDGKIITANCPVGLRRLRNLAVARWTALVSAAAALFYFPLKMLGNDRPHELMGAPCKEQPLPPVAGGMSIKPQETKGDVGLTGVVATPEKTAHKSDTPILGRLVSSVDRRSGSLKSKPTMGEAEAFHEGEIKIKKK